MTAAGFTIEPKTVRALSCLVGIAMALSAGVVGRSGGASWVEVAVDSSIGLAFVGAAVATRLDTRATVGVAGVGLAWLLASLIPYTASWHRGVLVLALGVWSLRPTAGRAGRALAYATTMALLLGLGGQPVAAALLVAAGVGVAVARQGPEPVRWHAVASLVVVGLVLGGSWTWSRVAPERFHPVTALRVYEVALLLVAVALVVAWHRARVRSHGRLQAALRDLRPDGLAPFVDLLRQALRDPHLDVRETRDSVDTVGDGTECRRSLTVEDDDGHSLCAVLSNSPALEDPVTAARVIEATRLAVQHVRLNRSLRLQLTTLENTRQRLLSVADQEREVAADGLREVVQPLLERAAQDIAQALDRVADVAVAEPARVAALEVATTSAELGRLVDGVAPFELGGGRLAGALATLAASSPVAVHVRADPQAAGSTSLERALYFACSEALANVHKHSRATEVQLCLETRDGLLVAEVTDDGVGGADAQGAGMTGIADRLAVHGGGLQVVSPRGKGTVVTASVPHPGVS